MDTLITLNNKPLGECYAFELGIIIRNLPEDGMRGSASRRLLAENELERRARLNDGKAVDVLNEIASERMGE